MLTICFGVDPRARSECTFWLGTFAANDPSDLERCYVGISVLLGMSVPILPAVLGHFGVDPVLNDWWLHPKSLSDIDISWVTASRLTERCSGLMTRK